MEVQAQLSALLGLHGIANSIVSISSIASFAANFAANTNAEKAYKQFRDQLYRIGVAKDVVQQNKDKILKILRSQGMVARSQIAKSQIGGSGIGGKDRALEAAYKEYCKDLYRIGFTDNMILQQKDEILRILRSRGMVASSKISIKDKGSSSSKTLPSFRLTSQVNWFESSSKAGPALFMPPLAISASHSHIGIVELVFGKGSSTGPDYNSTTLLHVAARGGYTWLAELLLGRTPLPKGVMELLFRNGASIDARSKSEYTSLELAITNGHTDIVDLLLSKGASIGASDCWGVTPLHLATQRGCTGIVELLLQKGASTEARYQASQCTPLHYATEHGHTGIVELLLKQGASAKAKDGSDRTPLHYATEHGHTGIVELLLKHGASTEAKDHRHHTPIQVAALHGHTNVVDLLLCKGASIATYSTLMRSAARHGSTGDSGRTLMHSAAHGGSTGVVELLLKKGISVDFMDYYDNTPLHVAAGEGHTDIVRLFLEKGASINAKNHFETTPLHEAVCRGHTDTVKLLLEEGASLEAKDRWKRTPLYCAKYGGHFETAQLLRNKAAELRRAQPSRLASIFRKR